MKVGSLVICKPLDIPDNIKHLIKWLPKPEEEIITIREIVICEDYGFEAATFEEGIIGYGFTGIELAINLKKLREVQPPEEGQNILEEALENELVNS